MSSSYTNYLNKKKKQLSENPYYDTARRAAFASMPNQKNFEQYSHRAGTPVSAVAQQDLNKQRIRQESVTGVVERAGALDAERKDKISDKIADIEFAKDQADEQKDNQKKNMLYQGAGAVIGGALGAFGGVQGAVAGAQLGGSLGQIAGGIDTEDYLAVGDGIGNALDSIVTMSKQKSVRDISSKMGDINQIMMDLDDPLQEQQLMNAYNQWVASGADLDKYDEIFSSFRGK